MMRVKALDFQYNCNFTLLRDIAFEARPGECMAILGNNGAGKSTLLKCLNRILSPQKGTVYVGEQSLSGMTHNQIARSMAFVEQRTQGARLTVYEMIMLGRKPYMKWGVAEEDEEIVHRVFHQMGLEDMQARYVDELSGGEQQKVMLARALTQQPKVLLLDEPTSNLDLRNQYEVMDIITRVCRGNDIAVIIVIHDLNLALRYCDRFLLIKDGQVFGYGSEEVINSDNIEEVYQIPVNVHTINGEKVIIPKMPGAQSQIETGLYA